MTAQLVAPVLEGNQIPLPISKSISNREMVLLALMGKLPDISYFSTAADSVALHQLLNQESGIWNAGLGGTTIRFGLAALCAMGRTGTVTGDEALLQRPIGPLVDALRQLGYHLNYTEKTGYPPVMLQGGIATNRVVNIDPAVSSQFVSAILLIGSFLPQGVELHYTSDPVSVPYLDLTISVIHFHGGKVERIRNGFIVYPKKLEPSQVLADRDWSAAAFWYAMVAQKEGASVSIPGLSMDSAQGDKIAHYLFNRLGVRTDSTNGALELTNDGKAVQEFEHDFSACPDLAQAVAVCCACKGIPATLKGLGTLRHKETDRIAALESELLKLGITVQTGDDWLRLSGSVDYSGAPIDTFHDHRMAMAFTTAAFVVNELKMNDPEVVVKSYPEFWQVFRQAGGQLLM